MEGQQQQKTVRINEQKVVLMNEFMQKVEHQCLSSESFVPVSMIARIDIKASKSCCHFGRLSRVSQVHGICSFSASVFFS